MEIFSSHSCNLYISQNVCYNTIKLNNNSIRNNAYDRMYFVGHTAV